MTSSSFSAYRQAPVPSITVLVVDDSVVVRRLVSDSLEADADLRVVATAANGKIALARVPQANPDVVILDLEMPELDGLETLSLLRASRPRLPVIMFSTLTERGAAATLEALARGASDYVAKPANVGGVQEAMARIRDQLIPRIKALCGRVPPARPIAITAPAVVPQRREGLPAAVELVAVGVSTGGPAALERLFGDLPGDLGVPVVVVQHMPPVFTDMLARRLDARSALAVAEARSGVVLAANEAWIAPGDFHLSLERHGETVALRTTSDPPENSCRPAVDVLFRSAAHVYGPGVLAVVMTGMGQDGWRGAEHVVEAGGTVLAQDEASSVVWGMPGYVASAGLAERVLPLDQLAAAVVRRARRREPARGAS